MHLCSQGAKFCDLGCFGVLNAIKKEEGTEQVADEECNFGLYRLCMPYIYVCKNPTYGPGQHYL